MKRECPPPCGLVTGCVRALACPGIVKKDSEGKVRPAVLVCGEGRRRGGGEGGGEERGEKKERKRGLKKGEERGGREQEGREGD